MCRHVEHCECEADIAVHAHGAGQAMANRDLLTALANVLGSHYECRCVDCEEGRELLRVFMRMPTVNQQQTPGRGTGEP